MKIKLLTILLSALITFCAVAVFVPAEYFVLERKWSIEWCQQATKLKLKKYDLIGQPNELRSWLVQVDGAPGQEAAVLFLSWGLDNKDDFALILDGIETERKPAISDWLAGMIKDRGMEQSFRRSFSDHDSAIVRGILAEVNRLSNDGDH